MGLDMRNSANKSQYLSNMGIVSWSARTLPYLAFQAQTSQGCVTLLTQIEGLQADQQQALWQKMIAALKASAGCIVPVTQFNFNEVLTGSDQLITLGQIVLPELNLTPIVTHGLYAMIQQPALKADVWHVLKNSFLS